jgi:sigma-E factor negative regulatory protein RseC
LIEETGIVTAVTDVRASVVRGAAAPCGGCSTAGQCGTSVLQNFFRRRQRSLDAWDPVGARPGDRVVVGISEGTLQRASWIAFFLPLVGLFVGAMLGEWLTVAGSDGELAAITGGLIGLFVGLVAARKIGERLLGNPQRYAKILRVIAREPFLE